MKSQEPTDGIAEQVFRIVTHTTSADTTELSPATKLEDIYSDSLELFALISTFEKEFSLKASYTELMHIETIGDIVEYLRHKLTPMTN